MINVEKEEKKQDGPRRMARFTFDSLQARKVELEQKLRDLGADRTGDQRSAQHDDRATEIRKDEIGFSLACIGDLSWVEIIQPRRETEEVGLGNEVSLLWEGEEQSRTYLLLGPDDKSFAGDKSSDIISYQSPVGTAILGKRVSNTVVYTLPDCREIRVRIIAIKPGNF